MEETIFAVIWVVIKSFITSLFSKKDPDAEQVKADIKEIKLEAIDMQRKPTGTLSDSIDKLPE